LQNLAKNPPNDDLGALQRWWSDKYKLPPNDPRFMDRPFAMHVRDFLEDLTQVLGRVEQQLRMGEAGEDQTELEETKETIQRILGIDTDSAAAWQDEVEKALEEGRMPNWGA